MSAYRINAKEKEDIMENNQVMSEQAFTLKWLRIVVGGVLLFTSIIAGSCIYSSVHQDNSPNKYVVVEKCK